MTTQKTNSPRSRLNAKTLRRRQTKAEQLLWGAIRNRKLHGLKFRRQHPIDMYIVDFYCHEKMLVVELDGDSHEDKEEYDRKRIDRLQSQGLRVLRIANEDVLRDVDAVFEYIAKVCDENRIDEAN